jgi:hypothetical protein
MDIASMYPNSFDITIQPMVPAEHITIKVLKNRNTGRLTNPCGEIFFEPSTICQLSIDENHFEDDLFEI